MLDKIQFLVYNRYTQPISKAGTLLFESRGSGAILEWASLTIRKMCRVGDTFRDIRCSSKLGQVISKENDYLFGEFFTKQSSIVNL